MFKRNTTKLKAAVSLIIALAVLSAYCFLELGIIYLEDLNKKEAEQDAMLAAEGEKVARIKKFFADYREDKAFVDSVVLDENNIVAFLERVEELGKLSGVNATVEQVANVTDSKGSKLGKDWEDIKVSLSAEGSWAQDLKYLSLLESLPIYSSIGNFELSLKDERIGDSADPKTKSKPKSKIWRGLFVLSVIKIK